MFNFAFRSKTGPHWGHHLCSLLLNIMFAYCYYFLVYFCSVLLLRILLLFCKERSERIKFINWKKNYLSVFWKSYCTCLQLQIEHFPTLFPVIVYHLADLGKQKSNHLRMYINCIYCRFILAYFPASHCPDMQWAKTQSLASLHCVLHTMYLLVQINALLSTRRHAFLTIHYILVSTG